MMENALFGGVNVAIVTPMQADLAPDADRLARRCSHLFAHGCANVAVLGTTGEANSFGISERLSLLDALIERGVPAERLLPGTGTTDIPDTVLLSRRAAELGCRGVLMLPPFYYKNPSDDGLFAYFSDVIEKLGGKPKIILYNFPQQSAVPFSLPLIARLLKAFPGVIKGIKDSSRDYANSSAMVREFAADGFEVYVGYDNALLDLLKLGGAGCITAAANVTSAINARVLAHWRDAAGEAAQSELTAFRKVLSTVPTVPALHALIAREEKDAGWRSMRPPHLPLSAAAEKTFFAAWDACTTSFRQAA